MPSVLVGMGLAARQPASCARTATCRLHLRWVTLIDACRARHVPAGHPLLHHRKQPLDRHTVTRMINRAGSAAGLAHIHPHQLRHTLATQAINRGMSLEAIAKPSCWATAALDAVTIFAVAKSPGRAHRRG